MKISVALCTHNGEKFLEEQLLSIFSQTLSVDEIIICDDCSTDQTIEIIQDFILKFPDIIKLFINENPLKTVKNFEKAVSLTTGDYIFLCDQDDVWLPEKTEKMISEIISNPKIILLFTNGDLINENGFSMNSTLWQKWGFDKVSKKRWSENTNAFNDLLLNNNYVTGATVLLNNKIKKKSLPIFVPNGYYHDTWFALHAAAENGLFFIDEVLIKYRIHKNQQVGININADTNLNVINKSNVSFDNFSLKIFRKFPQLQSKKTLKCIMLQFLKKKLW